MELGVFNFMLGKEFVDDVLGRIQGFRLKLELSVHVDDPFQQKSSLGVSNFCLNSGKVVVWNDKMVLF